MMIMPSVDILNGKCVRLTRGKPKESTIYYDDPLEAVEVWNEQGAEMIHVVDLNAALGSGNNFPIIKEILKTKDAEIQVGGGIRTVQRALELSNLGASRVVLGTILLEKPKLLTKLKEKLETTRIVAALDYTKEKIVTHGWKHTTELNVFSFAKKIGNIGVGWILFSATERDGLMIGPDLINIKKMVEIVNIPVIASGGVSSIQDIINVAKTGVDSIIIGKALYERRFTLKEAQKKGNISKEIDD